MTLRLRRRKTEPAEHAELVKQLRDIAGRLTKWSVTGTTGIDLPDLLREAARVIRASDLRSHEPPRNSGQNEEGKTPK